MTGPVPGTILSDRYEIRRMIGSGSMGTVYRGRDLQLKRRPVAIKILSGAAATGPLANEIRQRFISEVEILASVSDDNVVQIQGSGFTADADPYLVMELLEGQDLESTLRENHGPLPLERAVRVGLGMCAGVHACHQERIIHRDLKPANIFLQDTGRGERVKVLDFSVSKALLSARQSSLGFVVGTPEYMAPEQSQRGQADEKSDQYAIALILYRCLTGNLLRGVLPDFRKIKSPVPKSLHRTLVRALDFDPAARFDSVYDLGKQLYVHASAPDRGTWLNYYTSPQKRKPQLSGPIDPGAPPAPASGNRTLPTRVGGQGTDLGALTVVDPAPWQGRPDTAAGVVGDGRAKGKLTSQASPMPTMAPLPVTVIDRQRGVRSQALVGKKDRVRRSTGAFLLIVVGAVALMGGALALRRRFRHARVVVAAVTPALDRSTTPVSIEQGRQGQTLPAPTSAAAVPPSVVASRPPADVRTRPTKKPTPQGIGMVTPVSAASGPGISQPPTEPIHENGPPRRARRTIAERALAEVAQERWLEAADHLIDALDTHDAPWLRDSRQREALERALVVTRAHLGVVTITGTAGANIALEGRPLGTLPLSAPVRVVAGTVIIAGTAAGRQSREIRVVVPGGGHAVGEIVLPPSPQSSHGGF
jgi:hypothetical protein